MRRKSITTLLFLNKPWQQLLLSFILTIFFSIAASFIKNFNGAGLSILLVYHAPIVFAFLLFVISEYQDFWKEHGFRHIISLVVIACSLARVIKEIPLYSGHAFFITYMVLMVKSKMARIVAIIVLLDVIWLKCFVWHDESVWGGILFGLIAWIIYLLLQQKHK